MRRKKIPWKPNDVFAIPLLKGSYAIGHILDQRMINAVRIALYDKVVEDLIEVDFTDLVNNTSLISLIEVNREQLDYGIWKLIGNKKNNIPIELFANEKFRANKWINSIVRDAAIAEDFLNAYHNFLPWDGYHDINYLDKLLVSPSKKPNKLIYNKRTD